MFGAWFGGRWSGARRLLRDAAHRRDYIECMAARRLCTLPGVQRVELDLPAFGALTNPSILRLQGQWKVVARRPWYTLQSPGVYAIRPDFDGFSTGSVWIDCDEQLQPVAAVPIEHTWPLPPFACHGLEDPRVIECGGRLYCLWSALRADAMATALQRARDTGAATFQPTWDGATSAAVLGELHGASVRNLTPLTSPLRSAREKNWMPLQHHAEALQFVYSLQPMRVVGVDPARLRGDEIAPTSLIDRASLAALRGWSGSSQLVRWGEDGWLAVSHRAYRHALDFPGVKRVVYLHRFVQFDRELQVTALSRPFQFESLGIEFCAGLAVDGDRVVMSYGVQDRRAVLLALRRDTVNSLLLPAC